MRWFLVLMVLGACGGCVDDSKSKPNVASPASLPDPNPAPAPNAVDRAREQIYNIKIPKADFDDPVEDKKD